MDVEPDGYLPSNDVDEEDNDWDYNITGDNLNVIQEGTVPNEIQLEVENLGKVDPLHLTPDSSPLPKGMNACSEALPPHLSVTRMVEDSIGAYCCHLCSYTCDNKALLSVHSAKHAYTKTLSCIYCSYRTISDVHFARHLSDHEIEQQAVEDGTEGSVDEDDWQVFYASSDKPISADVGVEVQTSDSVPKTGTAKRKASNTFISANERPSAKKTKSQGSAAVAIESLFDDPNATSSLRYGKWSCSDCAFSTKVRGEMDQHLLSHNEFEGFSVINESNPSKNWSSDCEIISDAKFKNVSNKNISISPCGKTLIGAGSATTIMWYNKWRCSCCAFSTKDQQLMEEHLLTHHLNACKSREEEESKAFQSKEKQEITTRTSCSNFPLKTHLEKNSISTKCKNLLSENGSKGKSKTPFKCPFCPHVSVNLTSYEKHIKLRHISVTEESGKDASSPRMSSRPSTSHFKRSPNQTRETCTNSFLQDYDMSLSDEEVGATEKESREVQPKKKRKTTATTLATKVKSPVSTQKSVYSKKSVRSKNLTPSTPLTSLDGAALIASSEKAGSIPVLRVPNCPKWPQLTEEELAAITLVCPICPFKSFIAHQFEAHLAKLHKNAVVYTCNMCSFVSLGKKEYLEHKKPHDKSGKSPITLCCPNCFSKTNYYHSFVRHAKYCLAITEEEGFHSNGTRVCVFCKYRTCDLEMYKTHLLNHIRNEKLTCPKCPFETCRRDMYRLHLSLEHNMVPTKIRCSLCSYTTTQKSQLDKHMHYKHNKNRKIRMPPIIKTYLPVESEGKENKISQAGAESPDEEDGDECDFSRVTDDFVGFHVGSSVPEEEEEEEYLNSNEESLSSRTESCSKLSSLSPPASSEKKNHMKSPVKRQTKNDSLSPKSSENICLFCSQKFSSSLALGRHVKVHACEGRFTCPMCNFSSNQFKLLRSHFSVDHPEVLF